MYDKTGQRNPENAQTAEIRAELEARLPGRTVESNVPVVHATGALLGDIDLLVDDQVIVLLKEGNGSGQLAEAELFLPHDRHGNANPLIGDSNPNNLPVVSYAERLGRHAHGGLQKAGVTSFGGGRSAAERLAQRQAFLDHIESLIK